jgi:hypothetical protein
VFPHLHFGKLGKHFYTAILLGSFIAKRRQAPDWLGDSLVVMNALEKDSNGSFSEKDREIIIPTVRLSGSRRGALPLKFEPTPSPASFASSFNCEGSYFCSWAGARKSVLGFTR